MAILAYSAILDYIQSGQIKIEPFNKANVGAGSIDMTIDKTFRIFKKVHQLYQVTNQMKAEDFENLTALITVDDYLLLQAGETALGITVEKIELPANICGWIQGRSCFARIGLMVHITSNFIQPGSKNKQVLELFNAGPAPLALHPGTKVCQIILEEVKGKAQYKGRYQGQTTP